MIIVTVLSLGVAAYFIYKEFKNSKIIAGLKETIENLIEQNKSN